MKNSKRTQSLLQLLILIGIAFLANVLANYFYGHIDLTEEKRYTLTEPTKLMLKKLDDAVYVKVFLEGDFPAGFKRLQSSTKEMLDDFRGISAYVDYQFENPNEGTVDAINARRKELAKDGIVPTQLTVMENNEQQKKVIFPWALVTYKGRSLPVNLLDGQIATLSPEENINNSVTQLEYKFANAIQKLLYNKRPIIAFTTGHGELEAAKTADLEKSLNAFYEVGRIHLDSVVQLSPEIDVLIVAKPRQPYDDKDKFKLDQYVMNGGKVLWLIDRLTADLDSMRGKPELVPVEQPLNLEDLLFKYGARVEPNLVLDMECSKIPLRTGQAGQGAQIELFNWYYYPIAAPKMEHPIVKNLDRVRFNFPSTIDSIKTKTPIKKTVLLSSSQYSRTQQIPVSINFEILRYEADPSKFNKGNQPLALLLEGEFPSLYENRVTAEMTAGLQKLNMTFKERSAATKMLVVSDGDIIANGWDAERQRPAPLGYDPFMRYTFANKDFIQNTIEYMLDANGIIEARSRNVKLRLLDVNKAKAEKTTWQLLNLVVPLVFLAGFGAFYFWRRKKKYA